MKGAAAKQLGKMMAGQNLGKFFDTISTNVGKIAGQVTLRQLCNLNYQLSIINYQLSSEVKKYLILKTDY